MTGAYIVSANMWLIASMFVEPGKVIYCIGLAILGFCVAIYPCDKK